VINFLASRITSLTQTFDEFDFSNIDVVDFGKTQGLVGTCFELQEFRHETQGFGTRKDRLGGQDALLTVKRTVLVGLLAFGGFLQMTHGDE
jgi:hypothetical protein